jgi:hypothetical protein
VDGGVWFGAGGWPGGLGSGAFLGFEGACAFEDDVEVFVGPVTDVGDDAEFGAEFADDFYGRAGLEGVAHVAVGEAFVDVAHDAVFIVGIRTDVGGLRDHGAHGAAAGGEVDALGAGAVSGAVGLRADFGLGAGGFFEMGFVGEQSGDDAGGAGECQGLLVGGFGVPGVIGLDRAAVGAGGKVHRLVGEAGEIGDGVGASGLWSLGHRLGQTLGWGFGGDLGGLVHLRSGPFCLAWGGSWERL